MMRKHVLLLGLCAPWWWLAAQAQQVQAGEPPGPAASAPAKLPELKMPDLTDLSVMVPRPVKAVTAALGMGRQRLALVVGLGTVGAKQVLDSAPRDTQAVAATLRRAGYVVMVREDVSAADLRAGLAEFHERLQPGGVGFIYVTGLGVQVDGQNMLLARDATLDAGLAPDQVAAQLRSGTLPLTEVADALIGTPDSPRMLVVDAAYKHPALAGLPHPGLAAQQLPLGTMALFGHALGVLHEVPAVGALPDPAPADPAEIAASHFARALVSSLARSGVKGPDALRQVRKALAETYPGEGEPWIGGDTDDKEEFAESSLLDSFIPRTPEEWARQALSQGSRYIGKPSAAEAAQPVSQVLNDAPTAPPGPNNATSTAPAGETARVPEAPAGGSSLGSTLGSAVSTAATVANVAGTAAAVVAGVRVAEGVAAVSAASTAAGAAVSVTSSVASNLVSLGSRIAGSGGASEQPVQQVVRQAAAAQAPLPGSTVVPESGVRSTVAETGSGVGAPVPTAPPAPPVPTAPAAPAASLGAPAAATPPPAPPVALPAVPPVAPPATPPANPIAAPGSTVVPESGVRSTVAETATGPGAAPAGDLPVSQFATVLPAAAAVATAPSLGQRLARSAATTAVEQATATDGRTLRNPEGGERPSYVPRANSFGYAEGDTFTYKVIDAWKDEVTGQYTTAIDEVLDNGRLLANGHLTQMDPQGRLIRQASVDGSFSEFEPSQNLWWSNPKRGESHATKFIEKFQRANRVKGQTEWKGSTSVGGPRKIELPAGEFEVLPIETSGWYYETLANGSFSSGRFSRTVWYSPKLGHPVAIDIQDTDRLGKLLKRERVELVHAQVARGAP
jgi:hypothetical protein